MGPSFDSFVTLVPICLPDATLNTNTTSVTAIFCTLLWHSDEIRLLICILAPTVTKLQHFCKPKKSGSHHQILSPCGWSLGTRHNNTPYVLIFSDDYQCNQT